MSCGRLCCLLVRF